MTYFRDNVRMNQLAQDWYKSFVETDDWDKAWGAFEVMLRCFDARFYIWLRGHEKFAVRDIERKLQFIETNEQHIGNKVENRTKGRKDTLFGLKIPKGEIFPFIRPIPTYYGLAQARVSGSGRAGIGAVEPLGA